VPLALVSDIHGNDVALAAVVAELERLGIERAICLGDAVQGGPQPAFCDLEEHNALTAHQERTRLASKANPDHEESQ